MLNSLVRKIIASPVYDVAKETPLDRMRIQSQKTGCEIYLKREDQQSIFSFKLRGAYQKIKSLSPEERAKGVIAASAGNHAQGVALAARTLGCRATIVMPRPTATIKVDNVRRLGAEVILHGDNFDEACAHALQLGAEKGLSFIHPYDDEDVMAGQGTIAMEILRQLSGPVSAVFVPVGGGGLLGGMAAFIKFLRPEIRVFAVEPEDSACFYAARRDGARTVLPRVDLFAEGVAVKQIGEKTFEVLSRTVDGALTVTNEEIASAVKDIFQDTRAIAEPSGAVGLAGLKKYLRENNCEGETFVTVLTGANVNFERLRIISQMSDSAEGEILFAARLLEKPGSFKAFCAALGDLNVTEFNYRYADDSEAWVFAGVMLGKGQKKAELFESLRKAGYEILDLEGNRLAKFHIRHMVGGHAKLPCQETIYSVEFPERAGALKQFLEALGQRWSITMFHYRSLGASVGRVFMGLSIPEEERPQLPELLERLGYPYSCEDGNPVYERFLR